jgi:hypothetical protein
MAEYTQKRLRCDWCGRDVRLGDVTPPGWQESADFYGNTWHCCADPECHAKMDRFNRENYPSLTDEEGAK